MMKNIYLADDDDDDREFFEEALNELSMATQLTVAKDGVELMTTLEENVTEPPPPPHVIFLDLNMPNKNGFECLEEIRSSTKFQGIPVVIFSTTANENAVKKTYDLGANCYVCKPTSHNLLKKAIETVMALKLWEQNLKLSKENFLLALS